MTPDENLMFWLASLKADKAILAIQALVAADLVDVPHLVLVTRQHKDDPSVGSFLTTLTVSMLGDG